MKKHKPGVIPQIISHPISFSVSFFLIFIVTFLFLSYVGATPDPLSADTAKPDNTETEAVLPESPEAPVRVVVPAAGVDAKVSNPASLNMSALDSALLSGAARYPTSAMLGTSGTVLLFGHSSHLPVVHNKAYKAFNNIENLKNGEIISVYSGTTEYRYRVTGVKLADASEDVVQLPKTGRHLVLVTCDNFSKKTARFVVTADFVGAYSPGN